MSKDTIDITVTTKSSPPESIVEYFLDGVKMQTNEDGTFTVPHRVLVRQIERAFSIGMVRIHMTSIKE